MKNFKKRRAIFTLMSSIIILLWIVYQVYLEEAYFGSRFSSKAYTRMNQPEMYWGILSLEFIFLLYNVFQYLKPSKDKDQRGQTRLK